MLKAWMKRKLAIGLFFAGTYDDFLELATRESHCDRFARKQIAAGGVYKY
jgi:hypothetical protein